METYNPLSSGDLEKLNRAPGAGIYRITTEDPSRYKAAQRYLEAQGYRFGSWDDGDGAQVEGWKFFL